MAETKTKRKEPILSPMPHAVHSKSGRKPLKRTNKNIRSVIGFLLEKKAHNILVLDIRKLSGITDFIIIAGGSSDRQLNAAADNLIKSFKEKPLGHEGLSVPGSRWIVIDYGNMMIHLIHDDLRAYYNVEGLWPEAKELAVEESDYINADKADKP
jgi:ribosome-associated protein